MEGSGDCPVCCEPFNKSAREPVQCEWRECDYVACKKCVRRFLLSDSNDPACMSCHKAWSQRFLVASLNSSFVTSDYRTHHSKVLHERETARLSESMPAASRRKESEALEVASTTLKKEISARTAELQALRRERRVVRQKQYALLYGKTPEVVARAFIMHCPATACRGFLSTRWKCELCDRHVCKHCLDVVGFQADAPHTCQPEDVTSAYRIRKDTRPCPSCGVRIYKRGGCDSMWCTQCRVGFSWKTGKLNIDFQVENPHYWAWRHHQTHPPVQRHRDRARPARECPDDLPTYQNIIYGMDYKITAVGSWIAQATGALWGRREVYKILGFNPTELNKALMELYRLATMIHADVGTGRAEVLQLENFGPLRVQYLVGEIDDLSFQKQIFIQDAKRRKTLAVLHVMETLNTVLRETFHGMLEYCTSLETGDAGSTSQHAWQARGNAVIEKFAPPVRLYVAWCEM